MDPTVTEWTETARELVKRFKDEEGIDGQEGMTCTCPGRPDQVLVCDHLGNNLHDLVDKLGKECLSGMPVTMPSADSIAALSKQFASNMTKTLKDHPLVQATMSARKDFVELDASKFTCSTSRGVDPQIEAQYEETLGKMPYVADPREAFHPSDVHAYDVTHPPLSTALSAMSSACIKEALPDGCSELEELGKLIVPQLNLHYDLSADTLKCQTKWDTQVPALLHLDEKRHNELWERLQTAKSTQTNSDRAAYEKALKNTEQAALSSLPEQQLLRYQTSAKSGVLPKSDILSTLQRALRQVDSSGKHVPVDHVASLTGEDSERLVQYPCELHVIPPGGEDWLSWNKAQLFPQAVAPAGAPSGESHLTLRRLTREELSTLLSEQMTADQLQDYLSEVNEDGTLTSKSASAMRRA